MTLRRHTAHKERIQALFQTHHTLRASDIADILTDIPVSTICRNLERFVHDGVLRPISLGSRGVSYELSEHTHDHFVCDGCDSIDAIQLSKKTRTSVLPRGAHVHDGSIVIHGHCGNCAHSCTT